MNETRFAKHCLRITLKTLKKLVRPRCDQFETPAVRSDVPGTRLFGLAVSVTGHFGRDISVHRELIKL